AGVTLAAEPPPVWALQNRPRRKAWEGDAAAVYLRLFETGMTPGSPRAGPELRSPALPLLAVRAGRTAVAAGSADDAAWLSLARACLYLPRATWEADAGRAFPLLSYVRQVQAASALVQAVVAHPENPGGHEALAGLYGERGFLDLSVRHRRAQVQLVRAV